MTRILQAIRVDGAGVTTTIEITSVSALSTATNTITWQRSGAGTLTETSTLGQVGAVPSLPLTTGESVIVAEVFFAYAPLLELGVGCRTICQLSRAKPGHGTPKLMTSWIRRRDGPSPAGSVRSA